MRPRRTSLTRSGVSLVLLLSLVLVGCSDAPGRAPAPGGGGIAACGPGALALAGGGCQPAGLPPDMPCSPGELPLPDGSCQPAGVPPEACAPGFLPDGDGGCQALLPGEACPPGLMATPGETTCREVSPCGEGTWGEIALEATTEFVDASSAGASRDGSRELPWRTLQEGIDAAEEGAIVAVAAGRYQEDALVLGKAVRLWGRCPRLVEVVGRGGQSAALQILREPASGSEVRGLAVTGARSGIGVADGATSVVIEQVWVHDAASTGVALLSSGSVAVRGSLIEENHGHGVFVGATDATLESSVVRRSRPDEGRSLGRGVGVECHPSTGARARLAMRASVIDGNQDVGVFVAGSDVTIDDSVVRDTRPDASGQGGRGIGVQAHPRTGQRAALSLTRSLVDKNHEIGLHISGSKATVDRSVVRDTQPDTTGQPSRGIGIQADPAGGRGELLLRSSLVAHNPHHGVYVSGSDAAIDGSAVRDTRPDAEGRLGMGIAVRDAPETHERGQLSLTGSLIARNRDVGVFIAGSDATIDRSVVRDTQPGAAEQSGRGVHVQATLEAGAGGQLVMKASVVESNHMAGVTLLGATALLEASEVRDTLPAPLGGRFGDGVIVQSLFATPSTADLRAILVTNNARAGLLYIESAGVLSGVRASGNRFGLVLQGTPRPTIGSDSAFEGNLDQDRIADGDLEIPSLVPPLP